MRKRDIVLMAYNNLWRRKARTVLTCLGVLIGTASIIVMLSIGIGFKQTMERDMARWGSLNIIRIHPGMSYDEYGNPSGEEHRLNDDTVSELKNIPGVVAVSPAFQVHGEARLGRKNGWLDIVGVDLDTLEDLEFSVSDGRLPTAEERFTIVAGSQVINNFWDERASRMGGFHQGPPPEQDPSELLNQRISVSIFNQSNPEKRKNYNFMVVGILDEKNMEHAWQVFGSLDDIKRIHEFMVKESSGSGAASSGGMITMSRVVPMEKSVSSKRRSKMEDTRNDYNFILVRTKDVAQTKKVSAELRERGYNAYSMADSLEGIEKISKTIQAVLGGIGSITLFVAFIGITNTMIMSIYERTREIGIMKVIGASFADVKALFLAEASLIGLIGGALGLAFSYLVSAIINEITAEYMQSGMMGAGPPGNISVIPVWLAAFAVVFAILIGLGSGLYPANRAIKLSPIVAIRNE